MQIFEYSVPDDFNLFLFGDDHEGVSARHSKGWEKLLHMMNSEYKGCKHNFGVDHGDCIEGIMIDDKRYNDIGVRHDKILNQISQAVKNRKPIKDKLICLLAGNHDFKLWKVGDTAQTIAKELNVRYGDWTSIICYVDKKGRPLFKHYACHGGKKISSVAGPRRRRKTNMEVRLQENLKDQASDCFLMTQGHEHKLIVVPPDESLLLYSDKGHLKSCYTNDCIQQTGTYLHEDLRWYCCIGSFLKNKIPNGITYAEIMGLPPTELGFLVAVIRNRKLISIDKVKLL